MSFESINLNFFCSFYPLPSSLIGSLPPQHPSLFPRRLWVDTSTQAVFLGHWLGHWGKCQEKWKMLLAITCDYSNPCCIYLFLKAQLSTKFQWILNSFWGYIEFFHFKGNTNLPGGKVNDWISPHCKWIRVGSLVFLEWTYSTWC